MWTRFEELGSCCLWDGAISCRIHPNFCVLRVESCGRCTPSRTYSELKSVQVRSARRSSPAYEHVRCHRNIHLIFPSVAPPAPASEQLAGRILSNRDRICWRSAEVRYKDPVVSFELLLPRFHATVRETKCTYHDNPPGVLSTPPSSDATFKTHESQFKVLWGRFHQCSKISARPASGGPAARHGGPR